MKIEYRKIIRDIESTVQNIFIETNILKTKLHEDIQGDFYEEQIVKRNNMLYKINVIEIFEDRLKHSMKELLLSFEMKPKGE